MRYFALLLAALLLFLSSPAQAQIPVVPVPAQPAATASAAPVDPLGRSTPQNMIHGFLKAVGGENYNQAAAYLDLRDLSSARQKTEGPELAKMLQTLLDQGGWVEATSKLSNSPEGQQNDGLAPELDLVGTLQAGSKSVDLLAERHNDKEAGPIWRISRKTVDRIPKLLVDMTTGPLDRILPPALIDNKWYGVPIGHWLAILSVAALSLLPTWLLTAGLIYLIRRFWSVAHHGHAHHMLDALVIPIRLYITLGIFVAAGRAAGISIVARQYFILAAEIAAWLSLWWFLWRVIDITAETVQERLSREKRRQALSSVIFFRRSARLVLAAIAAAVAMGRLGLDVTAWLAALGVGGLALAFGAKTTLENFVVGLTLIMDQPLRIGDFCQIGSIRGTVEDIGMRSTRLITLDRTTVTIPNGMLASQPIENFTLRNSFWFHPVLTLRYETKPDQIRQLMDRLEKFLGEHPAVEQDSMQIRFVELASASLNIEIFSYVRAQDINEFMKTQTILLLQIMEMVDKLGIGFAFPSQTVYLARDKK